MLLNSNKRTIISTLTESAIIAAYLSHPEKGGYTKYFVSCEKVELFMLKIYLIMLNTLNIPRSSKDPLIIVHKVDKKKNLKTRKKI